MQLPPSPPRRRRRAACRPWDKVLLMMHIVLPAAAPRRAPQLLQGGLDLHDQGRAAEARLAVGIIWPMPLPAPRPCLFSTRRLP